MKKSFLVVYENLQEALQLYVDTSIELGYPLPEPTTNTVTLPIEGETDPKTTYVVERMSVSFPRPKTIRNSTTKISRIKAITPKRRTLQAA
jgi:hypothetical protein